MIARKILETYHAILIKFKKGAVIFREGEDAFHYFQLETGAVKMISRSDEGQEFIQGIAHKGESFGEPPILSKFPYPSTAVALENSSIWKMRTEDFFDLIKNNFDLHLKLDQILCERLRNKNKALASIAFDRPENRVLNLLNRLKNETRGNTDYRAQSLISLTRQQMADMTGLRVETIIRTVKKLEAAGKLRLQKHKILV